MGAAEPKYGVQRIHLVELYATSMPLTLSTCPACNARHLSLVNNNNNNPNNRRAEEEEEEAPAAKRRGWLAWIGLGGGNRSGGKLKFVGHGAGDDSGKDSTSGTSSGWWTRYEHETISMADLALTLVSACHPRDMPMFLARVQAIQKKRKQVCTRRLRIKQRCCGGSDVSTAARALARVQDCVCDAVVPSIGLSLPVDQ